MKRRSMKRVNVKNGNKPFKTLAIATIAGLSIIGVSQAQATTLDEVDLSQKPIDTPTLDYLHKNKVEIPQKTFQRDEDGNIVKDANDNPILQEGTPILAPQSGYSLTKLEANPDGSKPDGDNVITKFEVKDVTRYYDKTTGELVANPISGTEYKVVQEKDLVPQYYNVNTIIPESNNSKITWTEVTERGDNTITIYSPDGTPKYYKYTYNAPSDYDTTTNSNKTKDLGTITDPTGTYKGGAAINNPTGSTINIKNYVFQNNKTTAYFDSTTSDRKYVNLIGGAIYNEGEISKITSDFIGNSVSATKSSYYINAGTFGGAIYNNGKIGDITGDFINNTATAPNYSSGGAIYNGGTIENITGDFIDNSAASSGGAIYNNNSTIGDITGDFIGNTATSDSSYSTSEGGAIYNEGIIKNITGNFIGNTVSSLDDDDNNNYSEGGAIYNSYDSTIGNITGNFIGNSSTSKGGAISNRGTIDNITGDFIGNTAIYGGAIYNGYDSTIGNITGDFIRNTASWGGAIYNHDNSTIGDITGDFIGNTASASGSGAISNHRGTIGNITGDFIGNTAGSEGGAIGNYYYSTIGDITGDFIGNTAGSEGGAIHNYYNSTIGNITGDFIGNTAGSKGGAIYNNRNSTIGNITGNFISNTYGAIYNADNSTIGDITGDFIGNTASFSSGTIENRGTIGDITGDFISNKMKAIYNDSTIGNITGDFISNTYGAIDNIGTIGNITGDFIANTNDYFGAICNNGNIGDITGDFVGNYANYYGGAITNNGLFSTIGNITGNFINNKSGGAEGSGGAISNGGTIGDITGDFIGNYNAVWGGGNPASGGAISNSGTIGDIAGDFIGNYAKSETGEAKGGAIYSNRDLNIVADGTTSVFKDNYTESKGVKDDNAIYIDNNATLNFTMKNNGKFYMADNIDGTVTKDSDGKITDTYSVNIQGDDVNNTTFYMLNDIRNANVTFDNTTINAINNQTHVYNFNSLTVNSDTNFVADVDLANAEMDRITATNYGTHNGNLNVVGMNLLSDATKDVTEIYFAEQGLKDNVVNGMPTNGGYNLPSTAQTTFYTPIYKYNAIYDNRDDGGYFIFDRVSAGNNSGNASDNFNPAVLAPSVASQAGANATMNQTFNYAFQNSDNFMTIPYLERVAIKTANRYALSPTGDATDVGTFSPLFNAQNQTSSAWVKPYASFENIPLKNGPKVSNITYGTLVGFDTPIKSIKHGWDRAWTGYIGYNGASQRFSGVDATQNGGLVGGTLTLYKGNFFNATTVSSGAIVGDNRTMYGTDNYTMLMAGVGNKTGYNFEFKEGKIIIQPSMLLSYTFVNTFDYTNAAGVKIKNDPLHAIQIAPGVKFIANTKNGWQPYIGVNMIWNLLDKSKVSANDVRLPEMSIKPYVQYGVGVQKRFKDRYMAFGQAMIQNGGRNGISLTAGFRWAVGKEGKPLEKVQRVNNKTISSSSSVGAKSTIAQAQPERKIIKQLSQTQRERIAKQYQNTTRTTSIGEMKKL